MSTQETVPERFLFQMAGFPSIDRRPYARTQGELEILVEEANDIVILINQELAAPCISTILICSGGDPTNCQARNKS
jgi:hypothetical protein